MYKLFDKSWVAFWISLELFRVNVNYVVSSLDYLLYSCFSFETLEVDILIE